MSEAWVAPMVGLGVTVAQWIESTLIVRSLTLCVVAVGPASTCAIPVIYMAIKARALLCMSRRKVVVNKSTQRSCNESLPSHKKERRWLRNDCLELDTMPLE